jgi:hypothetical protein
MIDIIKQRQIIRLNGRPTPRERILVKLGETCAKSTSAAKDVPAIVLAHEKTSTYELIGMSVALKKAGCGSVRYFSFDQEKRSMFEVTFSSPVPFSSSGPP